MEYLHHLLGSLPPWAYVAIIGGGVAAAIFLPKLFGGQNTTGSTGTAGVTDAIDPNTGLPYPLSGYPGGAFAGGTTSNSGQTSSTADNAALVAALQAIAARLAASPSPAGSNAGGTSGTGTTNLASAAKKATTTTTTTTTTTPHVTAQPSTQSITAAKGSSQAVQNQVAVVNARLARAGF